MDGVFDGLTMHYNKVDLLYQQSLRYQYHAGNYREGLEQYTSVSISN